MKKEAAKPKESWVDLTKNKSGNNISKEIVIDIPKEVKKKTKTKPKKKPAGKRATVLGIVSPKGGVGKTVTTANLAVSLSMEFNKKVIAIDTNVTTASLGFHFNILYPETSIYDIIKKDFSVNWAMHHYNDNLAIVPASIAIDKRDTNINNMHKNVAKVVKHYKGLLKKLAPDYDFILLDAAGGFGVEAIATMQVVDMIIMVTNPEYPAVVATAKCISYARILKVPVAGIVLAKVQGKNFELSKEKIEESLKVPVIGEIPADVNVPKSIAHKVPVLLYKPNCKASLGYKKVAASLLGLEYRPGFTEKLKALLSF